MSTFKTPKGTDLFIRDFRGKPYMEVAWRLVWFREEKPLLTVETEMVQLSETYTIAKAIIKDEAGRVLATAHKREDKAHFADHMEKAETGAVGRALGYLGYGTQFAPELAEDDRIVDSPTQFPSRPLADSDAPRYDSNPVRPAPVGGPGLKPPGWPGCHVVKVALKEGKGRGLRVDSLPEDQVRNVVGWWRGKPMDGPLKADFEALEAWDKRLA